MNNTCTIKGSFASKKLVYGNSHKQFADSSWNYWNDCHQYGVYLTGNDSVQENHKSHTCLSNIFYIYNFACACKASLSSLVFLPIFSNPFFALLHTYSNISNKHILSPFYSAFSFSVSPSHNEHRCQSLWHHLYLITCVPFSAFSLLLLYAKVALNTSVIFHKEFAYLNFPPIR